MTESEPHKVSNEKANSINDPLERLHMKNPKCPKCGTTLDIGDIMPDLTKCTGCGELWEVSFVSWKAPFRVEHPLWL